MLGRRKRLLEEISFLIDVLGGILVMIAVYFFLHLFGREWQQFLRAATGYPFNIQTVTHLQEQGWLFLVILLNLFAALKLNRFYQIDLFAKWPKLVFQSLKCVAIGMGMTAVFFYFFSIIQVNRSLFFGFAGVFLLYLITKETLLRSYLLNRHYRKRPLEALLVCSTESAEARMTEFSDRQLSGITIKGIVLSEGSKNELPAHLGNLVVGNLDEFADILSKGSYDFVFLGLLVSESKNTQKVLNAAEEQGIDVWYFAEILTPILSRPEVDEYGGKPVIIFKTTPNLGGKVFAKRLFDVVVSSTFLVLLCPLLLLIAFLIRATSKGPAVYAQRRTGLRGKSFSMYKFRTMKAGAEDEQSDLMQRNEMKGPVYKLSDDPRVTVMGCFLRRYSLDELPQLHNVLKGEMSLVGPRPLPVYETENFEAFKDHRRYSVLPGLTGLWQVSGRNEIADFSEWVKLDLEYIDSWSLWLDMVIIFRTIPVVLSGVGAK